MTTPEIGDVVEWYDGDDNRMGIVRKISKTEGLGVRVSGREDPVAGDNNGGFGWSAWTLDAEVHVVTRGAGCDVRRVPCDETSQALLSDLVHLADEYGLRGVRNALDCVTGAEDQERSRLRDGRQR